MEFTVIALIFIISIIVFLILIAIFIHRRHALNADYESQDRKELRHRLEYALEHFKKKSNANEPIDTSDSISEDLSEFEMDSEHANTNKFYRISGDSDFSDSDGYRYN